MERTTHTESMLVEMVAAGDLPPVDESLPAAGFKGPLALWDGGHQEIGQYGGSMGPGRLRPLGRRLRAVERRRGAHRDPCAKASSGSLPRSRTTSSPRIWTTCIQGGELMTMNLLDEWLGCDSCVVIGAVSPTGLPSSVPSYHEHPDSSEIQLILADQIDQPTRHDMITGSTVVIRWDYRYNVCTGTHVGNGLVLTAGHCVYDEDDDRYPALSVGIGCNYADDKPCKERPAKVYGTEISQVISDVDSGWDVVFLRVAEYPLDFRGYLLPLERFSTKRTRSSERSCLVRTQIQSRL